MTFNPDEWKLSSHGLSDFEQTLDDSPDPKVPSIALVISDGAGRGRVIEHAGHAIGDAIENIGAKLDDLGLDAAPKGLSIWTGKYVDDGPGDWPGSREVCLSGEFRELTAEEWNYFAEDLSVWDLEPYKAKTAK